MENLLKLSLIISFLGVFSLFLISTILQPKQVNSYQDLKLNQKVITQSTIKEIKTFNKFSIITLDNNITITCNCKFKEKEQIEVEGKVTSYKNQLQIQAEQIHLTN
tara:strand:- start:304 stop:621 length:318 start_codon:yes stop_codon:yes gene_type:complete